MTATTLTARPALPSEFDTVLALCLEAFADEAVTAWVVPDPCARLAAMREMLAASLAAAVDSEALVVAITCDSEAVGASIWIDQDETPQDAELPAGDDLLTQRLATVRSLAAARHPKVPHIYLASMGTLPKRRGLGAGTAMLRYGLDRARRLDLPVYLEASTPLNRKLYARHGFADHGAPLQLPEGRPSAPTHVARRVTAGAAHPPCPPHGSGGVTGTLSPDAPRNHVPDLPRTDRHRG